MLNNRTHAECIAENYYDSPDADNFYAQVWGGEDIHIGCYQPEDSIYQASRRTVATMADRLTNISPQSQVIDLGSGYGGSARYLANRFACHVTCLNVSDIQNDRNKALNQKKQLDSLISVLHGSFEDVPCNNESKDLVWSQDAFLHSGNKQQMIAEIARILKPGGEVIFTDPMQSDHCPDDVLQPVYDRLSLDSLASFAFYRSEFAKHGMIASNLTDLTPHLRHHYASVKQELVDRYTDLNQTISNGYIDKMIQGLDHWIQAADSGYLAWGILHFHQPVA